MHIGRLLFCILSCLFGAGFAHIARAAEATLTLPLRLYTFPELASALSAEGRTVVSPAAFEQRVALVRLEKRSWDIARGTLEASFGIRIRRSEVKTDTWLMELDPAVEARQDRALSKLAELTVQAARESVLDLTQYAELPYGSVLREAMRADLLLRLLEQTDPDGETEETQKAAILANSIGSLTHYPVYVGARSATRLRVSDVLHAMRASQRFTPVDLAGLRASSAVQEFVDYVLTSIRTELATADIEGRQALQAEMARVRGEQGLQWTGAFRLDFDPLTGSTRGQLVIQHPGRAEETTGFYADPVQDRWSEILPRLDKGIAESIAREEQLRPGLLKEPAWITAVKHEPGRPPSALSEWLEAWSRQTGAELVMELAPGREMISWESASSPDIQNGPIEIPSTLAALVSSSQPGSLWSWSRRDSIWIFESRLRFLDRLRPRPTAALIALERNLRAAGDGEMAKERWLGAVTTFHQAVSPEASAACGALVGYRSLELSIIATARPAVLALSSVSSQQREAIRAALAEGKAQNILVASLPTAAVRGIVTAMREMALSPRGYSVPGEALLDSFAQSIRRYALHLRQGESSDAVAAFILARPTPNDSATDYLEVELPSLSYKRP